MEKLTFERCFFNDILSDTSLFYSYAEHQLFPPFQLRDQNVAFIFREKRSPPDMNVKLLEQMIMKEATIADRRIEPQNFENRIQLDYSLHSAVQASNWQSCHI